MDLLFDFTPATNLRASVVGTMTRPIIVNTDGLVDLLGVRFRPGALAQFCPLDAADVTDSRVSLTNFWGQSADEIWDRMVLESSVKRIELLKQMLLARRHSAMPSDLFVHHCITRIETAQGDLRIRDLEKTTGLTSRQLERKFLLRVGISPKTFARIVRFKGVERAVGANGTPDWAAMACEFGFADQPHLVREFKTFSGFSPASYANGIDRDR